MLLQKAGTQTGPTGGDTLAKTTFVSAGEHGGSVAPPTGCDKLPDVDGEAFMPYTADYVFYTRD